MADDMTAGREALPAKEIRVQARRYLEAVYGPNVWYRAPETFGNLLERWIWAVAADSPQLTETSMAAIERLAAERDAAIAGTVKDGSEEASHG